MNSKLRSKENKLAEIAATLAEVNIKLNAQGWSVLSKWIREFGHPLVKEAIEKMTKSNLQNKNENWIPYTFGIIKRLSVDGEFELPLHKKKNDILADLMKEEDD